jgi:DNA-binding beta-propeller fold protein YncE
MKRALSFVTAFSLILTPHLVSAKSPVAKLGIIETFRTGDAKEWDYPIIDSNAHRLYVACSDHVQVIDTNSGKRIGDMKNLDDAHGIAIVNDKKLGFITSGGENAIAVFDLRSLRITKKIKTSNGGGKDPDPIIYDPASKMVFALCAGGDAVAIDPANLNAPPKSIHCGGKLEYGRADGAGKLFINNEDKSEIEVIDTKAMKLVDHWPLAPVESPSGLAIDTAHHRLFAVGENKKMVVLDFKTGKPLGSVNIGEGADGCAYDPKLGVALSSNGDDGTVSVVAETSPGNFEVVQTIETAKSGATIVDDPVTSWFYIPAKLPAQKRRPAEFGVFVLGQIKR